ncbi:hypothetical protein FRC12_002544 [Ceratobasidium sp. 428]|nr:hypothetical protein FRC12_002544 [Ceratobasidium sp. 428]
MEGGEHISIYDIFTGRRLIGGIGRYSDLVQPLAFSPDGRTLAAGSDGPTICLWDTQTGNALVGPLRGHSVSLDCLAFSLDSRFLVSGSEDYTLRIWNARTGEMLREVRPHLWPWSLCFIHGNRLAVSWGDEWTITVYEMDSVTALFKCVGHGGIVHALSILPDGRLLASGSSDHTIRFWNPASGASIGEPLKGHLATVQSIRFSPDSRYITSGSIDRSIRMWDTETRAPFGEPLIGHLATVMDVAFTLDGKNLVSVDKEGTVKIWDVHSLQIGTEVLSVQAGMTAHIHETEPTSTDSPGQAISLIGAQDSAAMTDHREISLEPEAEITSATTPEQIVSRLSLRGCADMTHRLNLAACSEIPISSGGFGDIHRGRLNDGTRVAIKTIRLYDGSQDRKILKKAQHAAHEIYAWSKCKHPNVQPLLGLAMFRGRIGMIARWESNGNLPQYLEQRADVDRCALSSQISEGLSYLHASGVIHGDLKGVNVLISQDGVAQLADFGNAKLQEYSLKFTQTSTKEALSSRWAAPELFEDNPCNYATDVYALGMTILEAITGDVPWTEKSERAIMFAITMKRVCPERPETYIPSNSAHGDTLWALLKSCWEFEPEEPPSAANVAQLGEMQI